MLAPPRRSDALLGVESGDHQPHPVAGTTPILSISLVAHVITGIDGCKDAALMRDGVAHECSVKVLANKVRLRATAQVAAVNTFSRC